MNPVTICSGFRRCGVYPLNPDVIDCSISIVNPEASLHEVDEDASSQDNQSDDGMSDPQQCNNGQSSISPEKAALFQQRFEEGYDLPDDDYVKWLHETHPESITNQTASAIENGTSHLQQCNDTQSSISPEKAALFQRRFEEGYDLPDDEYAKWLHETHPESIMSQTASAINNDTLGYANQGTQITHEKLLLYEKRFKEGYDFPDEEYMKWLHENHPESKTECVVRSNNGSDGSPLSIADAFFDLPIASPLSIVASDSLMETTHDKVSSTMLECDDDKLINRISTTNAPQRKDTESTCTGQGSQRLFDSKGDDDVIIPGPNSTETKTSAAEDNRENDKLRYISKQFVPHAKPRNKETAVRISGARVLTSDKCAAILKEREEKIKKQQEEKERRKLEREQKRKEKEEPQRKKKAIAAEKRL